MVAVVRQEKGTQTPEIFRWGGGVGAIKFGMSSENPGKADF